MVWKSTLKKFVMGNLVRKELVPIPTLYGNLLEGRSALITGGTSGIGYSIAEVFLRNGCEVVITGRNQNRIDAALNSLGVGCPVHGLVLDGANVEAFEEGLRTAIDRTSSKKIDILVNNAGVNRGDGFKSTVDDWDIVIDVNLRGAYFMSQKVAKYMKDEGIEGNILNVSSSSALRPADRPYTLSKWGVRGMDLGACQSPHPIWHSRKRLGSWPDGNADASRQGCGLFGE